MLVEIAIQCHNFQRRLCWMLSSILQQDLPRDMELVVSVAYLKGNGTPTTEEVIDHFRAEGLIIKDCAYDNIEEFQYRGWTRNRQLKETRADWIMWADTDMCYPSHFFKRMYKELLGEFKDSPHCLHSRRFSTTLAETEDLVDNDPDMQYPRTVTKACSHIKRLPGKKKSNVGAGYMHLANVKNLRDNHEGLYQPEGKKIDRSWKKGQKAKSDMQFRRRLGGKKIPLPLQYHIQHIRDNEVGHHTEVQR